ncbi:MAG: serine/threonine-protein kinase, partial [Planctomycetota bacterium]
TDFGISSMAGMSSVADMDSSHTVVGTIMGTPTYMSPEQARGESVDHRADLYSLGCVFYELLTGSPPFAGRSGMEIAARRLSEDPLDPRRLAPHVPAKLAHACMRALSRTPEDRYESAAEMLAELLEASPSKEARGLFGSFGRWFSGPG